MHFQEHVEYHYQLEDKIISYMCWGKLLTNSHCSHEGYHDFQLESRIIFCICSRVKLFVNSRCSCIIITYFIFVFLPAAYIICWCPFSLYYTLDAFSAIKNKEGSTSFAAIFIQNLPSLNSAVNPFIYGIFSTNICKELR